MPAQIVHGHSEQQVVIQKRYAWVPLIFFSTIALVPVVLGFLGPPGSAPSAQNANPAQYDVFLGCLSVILFLLGYFFSGPSEIRMDLQHRRYTLKKGLPLLVKTTHGQLDEIKEVVGKITSAGKGMVSYEIWIEWNSPGRKTTLITSTGMNQAYAILDEVKAKLNVSTRWDDKT